MKNLRNLMATITLTGILIVGASVAKAGTGLFVSDFAQHDSQPCTETSNTGIIVTGFTGIIVTGFTGIIVTGFADSQTNCGILLTD